ncbi:MAG: SHD1 domain-containing protein [Aureliella sp.]
MTTVRTILLTLGFVALAACSSADEPLREWTDKSGQYQVDAKLISISEDGKVVSLELVDRQSIDVPLDRLSDEDHAYLARYKRLQSQRSKLASADRKRQRQRGSRAANLYGIRWHQTLESAQAASQPLQTGTGKPIMCFRVLGDLAGFM